MHNSVSLRPKIETTWSSGNYLVNSDRGKPVTVTYNMNILQSLDADQDCLVRLNSTGEIDSNKIIKKSEYHNPLFTVDGVQAQSRKKEISGINNTFYCGAYWGNGFHEDGVNSALEVCRDFGVTL